MASCSLQVYIKESRLNPNSVTLEPDRWQHYRLAVCVIVQQYSSATLVSMLFHSRRKNTARNPNMLFQYFYFFLMREFEIT
jgi:hypothetical protein